MDISITKLEQEGELHCHYSGQINAQDCYVELDCDAHTLTASYDAEIGNAVPMAVWHGRTRRFKIAPLRTCAANSLLEEAAPLAERIVAGYESKWDGSNWVGTYSDDAQQAADDLQALCDSYSQDEECLLQVWDAEDWLYETKDDLGITADTTDDELKQLATRLRDEVESDGIYILRNLDEYLEQLRSEAKAAAEDED